MPVSYRLDGVIAKKETTLGVDASPSATTNGIRVARLPLWSKITVDYKWENNRQDVVTGTIVPPKGAIPRGRKVKLDIFWEVQGPGSDIPPFASALYQASGLLETDGTNLFDYTQASGSHASATIYAYSGNVLYPCVGCRGRWQWPMVVGEIAIHQFTMYGFLGADPTEVAVPAAIQANLPAPDPLAGVSTALLIDAYAPVWLSGNFDPIGTDPVALDSGNAAPTGISGTDGIREFDYGEVTPRFTLTVRKDPLGTFNPMADLKARTTRALTCTFGTAAANRVQLVNTNISLVSHGNTDSQAFTNWNLSYLIEQFTLRFPTA